jgi:integrase
MGELLALRWADVDFTAETIRVEGSVDHRSGVGTPKSGHGRAVPMAPEVATALAKVGQREHFTGPEDFVFPNATGGYQDNSALRRRYKDAQERAKLEPLRFHDLRHTFGTIAISQPTVSTRQVQEWLGHADSRTTVRYTHYTSRAGEAKLLAEAFKVEQPEIESEPAHEAGWTYAAPTSGRLLWNHQGVWFQLSWLTGKPVARQNPAPVDEKGRLCSKFLTERFPHPLSTSR